ncbi:MAG TPA: ornithine cyclodeaminase family protein [Alphaproteobacteria bacterium]|nr:ornithine cyclodeaminase family protein [Alphaproteobacteria bacterium]
MTLLLSNDDVGRLLTMPDCIAALEDAYAELAEGRGVNRIRSDSLAPVKDRPEALYGLKSMDGIIPKFGVGAVRIDSDVVHWPKRGNTMVREKVPAAGGRWVGLVLLFSCETGEPLAIFPDGVMQHIRVGATSGLGAKYMARNDAHTVGILGSGWQAQTQLSAICSVREIDAIRCFSPTRENREKFSKEMTEALGIEVKPVDSPEEAIKGVDVVMCASNAIDNIYFARWLQPGIHLSSIKRPEIEVAAIKKCDRVASHSHEPTPMHFTTKGLKVVEKSEGKGWSVADQVDFTKMPTLPDMIVGRYKGRTNDREITCFMNNLGMGYQFAAAGSVVYRKAVEQGVGRQFPTEWFTQDVHP